MNNRVNTALHCLAMDMPTHTPALESYCGLARRTLLNFLIICREQYGEIVTISDELYAAVWKSHFEMDSAGLDLDPIPASNEAISNVRYFIAQLPWHKLPEKMKWRFELVIAVDCDTCDSKEVSIQRGQAYCDSFPIMSQAQFKWIGFDLNERNSTWSALANIGDWRGPQYLLNAYGLCENMDQMVTLRELYFQSNDPDRMGPEDYQTWGLIRTSFLDGAGY